MVTAQVGDCHENIKSCNGDYNKNYLQKLPVEYFAVALLYTIKIDGINCNEYSVL